VVFAGVACEGYAKEGKRGEKEERLHGCTVEGVDGLWEDARSGRDDVSIVGLRLLLYVLQSASDPDTKP
jgi:hypothetical protein